MKNHPELAAWLPTARKVGIAEMLTITSPAGWIWRYATGRDVTVGIATWSALALLWERSRLTFSAGIEVSSCSVTIYPRRTDLLGGMPVASAIRNGAWDDATMLLSRAYFDEAGALRGVLPRFQGELAGYTMKDGALKLSLASSGSKLNRAVPPVYQASCLNTLFDYGCGLSRSAWEVTGVTGVGSTAQAVQSQRGEAPGWFTGGVLYFTGGVLEGLRRTVRQHLADGVLTFFEQLPAAPASGDSFRLSPGCDRTLGAGGCAKFNNRLMYRGHPFIPQPETVV